MKNKEKIIAIVVVLIAIAVALYMYNSKQGHAKIVGSPAFGYRFGAFLYVSGFSA